MVKDSLEVTSRHKLANKRWRLLTVAQNLNNVRVRRRQIHLLHQSLQVFVRPASRRRRCKEFFDRYPLLWLAFLPRTLHSFVHLPAPSTSENDHWLDDDLS